MQECIAWKTCDVELEGALFGAMAVVANKEVVGATEETPSPARYETLVFDLDDTLYPLSSGLAQACRLNIETYMVEKLGIDPAVVPDMCNKLYKAHGTTMAGLWAEGYCFDHDDFHKYFLLKTFACFSAHFCFPLHLSF